MTEITRSGDADDELVFMEEDPTEVSAEQSATWRILIADDDETVHSSTLYALGNVTILNRRLEFLHAYSAAEARQLLEQHSDIAAVLLDVVMERDDAGLKLVQQIRQELKLEDVRLILRTGQPGYAPEIDVIRDYDINDYKTKAELTRTKLYTTLTAALRSYLQIRTINANRKGLDLIVSSSSALIATHSLQDFANSVIAQLATLLGCEADGVVSARTTKLGDTSPSYRVVTATSQYRQSIDQSIEELPQDVMRDSMIHCFEQRRSQYTEERITLFFPCSTGRDMCVYLRTTKLPDSHFRALLEVFCSNISVCLNNLSLFGNLKHQAYYDQLLLLPNRHHLLEQVDRVVADKGAGSLAMMLVDIDHFSELNHALGHQYGDQLLRQVSQRLQKFCRPSLFLARITSDIFAIFGPSAEMPAEKIQRLFSKHFTIEGNEQTLSATFGLAQISEVDGGGQGALKAASTALNQAKQTQRGQLGVYTRQMGLEIQSRVKMLQDLRLSFEHQRLYLHYQPQVSLPDGKPVGCEALIRWRDDQGRYIPPDVFIPLAERSGIIATIGEWVMRTAFSQAHLLHRSGFTRLRMAVNVSVIQFRSGGFLETLDRALLDSGVNPELIELEITESVAMLEADYLLDMLKQIKSRGVQVAIDDFGTGFSSLSYLQRLSIDRLKIDRAFVDQLCESQDSRSIAEMVIELSHSLNLQVIAEGVEEQQQAERLAELGCHEAQGYFYAKPMEADALLRWLMNQEPGNTQRNTSA
ncbi:EAL domain-containing protein [Motiliproteus coralliicola]|uniref:EAL domain-containing protein n=1 Tax=Motiliproteus coralliicola TaxID=2283196 RepID=A0A369WRP6_9GAMM|nr:EAL domain-containing protein [Motiliproteus coralliicola]RDE24221.1 EAL domain-containing protein [Motiliproteus coralliicola]